MKFIFTIITVLTLSGILYSQDMQKKTKKAAVENIAVENKITELSDKPVIKPVVSTTNEKNSLLVFGGYHKYLYGYKDVRYKDKKDQGDYLKTYGQFYGIEYSFLGFGKEFLEVDNIKIGGLGTFYYRGSLPSKNLYAVTGHSIAAETILPNINDRTQVASMKLGVFAGVDEKWYELSTGFHADIIEENEKERLYLSPDSTIEIPVYEPRKGRGWTWSDGKMRLNFLARLGLINNAHFTLAAFRDDYDPNYGKIMAKIFFPVNEYFKMQIGTYLYPTDAIFIQPVFTYSGISLSPRIGIIVNYRNDDFQNVGIFEGTFMTLSASYIW